MSSPPKKRKAKPSPFNSTVPWTYTSFGNQVEIEASFEAGGEWTTIAQVNAVADHDAEDVASFIVDAVNEKQKTRVLLRDLARVVEACLTGTALSEKTRRAAAESLEQVRALNGATP